MEKGLKILKRLEKYRIDLETGKLTAGCPDHTVRMCQAYVAEISGYKNRNEWTYQIKD